MKKLIQLIVFLIGPVLLTAQLSSTSYQTIDNGSYTSGGYSAGTNSQNFIVSKAYTYKQSSSANYSVGNEMPAGFIFVFCNDISLNVTGATSFCEGGSVLIDAGSGFTSYQWSNNENTASISAMNSGDYYVLVTDTSGCSSISDTVSVVAWEAPSPNIIGAMDFCQGDTITLDAGSGFSSYQWNNGDTSQTVSTFVSDTFFVQLTDTNSCVGFSDTVSVQEVDNPIPTITQVGVDSLFTEAASTYQWYLNDVLIPGATNQGFKVTATGDYSVSVENSIGCMGSSTTFFVQITGVREVANHVFNVYPNPTQGLVHVSGEFPNSEDLMLEIHNVLGQQVFFKNLKPHQVNLQLDIRQLPNAYYIVTIRDEHQIYMNTEILKRDF